MEITLKEHIGLTALEYEIATPHGNLLAKSLPAFFKTAFEICSSNAPVAHLEEESSVFRSRYRFTLQDGRSYSFESEKLWSPVYQCIGAGETWSLHKDSQHKLSIQKDGNMMASITRSSSFWKPVEYTLSMEDDASVPLAICMVLAMRAIERASESAAVQAAIIS